MKQVVGMQGSMIVHAGMLIVRIHLGGGKCVQGNYILYVPNASLPGALEGLLHWVSQRIGNTGVLISP